MNEKKAIKSVVRRSSISAFLYVVIVNVVVTTGALIRIFAHCLQISASQEEFLEHILKIASDRNQLIAFTLNGLEYIISVCLIVMIAFFIMKKYAPLKYVFDGRGHMQASKLLIFVVLMMSAQVPFMIFDFVVETLLNQIGYSISFGVEMATTSRMDGMMLVYAAFIGPVAEELIYRGFIMKSLERYGKTLALVMSSLFFSLMHANLPQCLFAFWVGLVLGYVAMHYSLVWSMVLHIINNFVFGVIYEAALKYLPEPWSSMANNLILGAFFLATVVILFVKRKECIAFIRENRARPGYNECAYSTVLFILFTVFCFLASLLVIQPMN